MATTPDPLIESYAKLKALKDNLPEGGRLVESIWVEEFHAILTLLEKALGLDLSRFKIPADAEYPPKGYRGPSLKPLQKSYDRGLLMMRIDSVLNFFEIQHEIQQSSPKPRIGF